LGDGLLKVTIPAILRDDFSSVKGKLEVHYDFKLEEIAFIAIYPRRNGKTTEVSATANAVIEVVPNINADVTATSQEQSMITLDMCRAMFDLKYGFNHPLVAVRMRYIEFRHAAGPSKLLAKPMNEKVSLLLLLS
jgi:hypothetical protein